jgi:hypothetical protein
VLNQKWTVIVDSSGDGDGEDGRVQRCTTIDVGRTWIKLLVAVVHTQ